MNVQAVLSLETTHYNADDFAKVLNNIVQRMQHG